MGQVGGMLQVLGLAEGPTAGQYSSSHHMSGEPVPPGAALPSLPPSGSLLPFSADPVGMMSLGSQC